MIEIIKLNKIIKLPMLVEKSEIIFTYYVHEISQIKRLSVSFILFICTNAVALSGFLNGGGEVKIIKKNSIINNNN